MHSTILVKRAQALKGERPIEISDGNPIESAELSVDATTKQFDLILAEQEKNPRLCQQGLRSNGVTQPTKLTAVTVGIAATICCDSDADHLCLHLRLANPGPVGWFNHYNCLAYAGGTRGGEGRSIRAAGVRRTQLDGWRENRRHFDGN